MTQRREMERKLKAAWPQYRTGNETFDAIVRTFGPAELRAQRRANDGREFRCSPARIASEHAAEVAALENEAFANVSRNLKPSV